jgi:type VI secretion system secreted protein Hcp
MKKSIGSRLNLPVVCKFLLLLIFIMPWLSKAQNVGIGVNNPTEKLQVGGIVHSTAEGFRFPDGSLQTRAYNAYETQDAGDVRWIVIIDFTSPEIPGSFGWDTIQQGVKVIDYQWESTCVPDPSGGGPATFTIGDISITKNIDLSSNELLGRFFNGQVFQEFWIYFFRLIEGQGMQIYYRAKVNNSVITAFDQRQVFRGGDTFSHIETINFQFEGATWYFNEGPFSNETEYP